MVRGVRASGVPRHVGRAPISVQCRCRAHQALWLPKRRPMCLTASRRHTGAAVRADGAWWGSSDAETRDLLSSCRWLRNCPQEHERPGTTTGTAAPVAARGVCGWVAGGVGYCGFPQASHGTMGRAVLGACLQRGRVARCSNEWAFRCQRSRSCGWQPVAWRGMSAYCGPGSAFTAARLGADQQPSAAQDLR